MIPALTVLVAARKLIEKPEDWRAINGPHGRRYGEGLSIYEAFDQAARANRRSPGPAEDAFAIAAGDVPGHFNDTHTHAEVLAAFDKAIEAERAKDANGTMNALTVAANTPPS